MGQCASAYLAFGFDLGHEPPSIFDGNDYFEDYGLEVVYHGYDSSGKFLALRSSIKNATWDNPQPISFSHPPEEAILKLKQFCAEREITFKEPGWHLMAHFS